jgi:hypothetical protein
MNSEEYTLFATFSYRKHSLLVLSLPQFPLTSLFLSVPSAFLTYFDVPDVKIGRDPD